MQRRAGLWQRSCPACGKFVVDLKVAERWCDVLNCLCGCWIYPMPDVILLDQRTSSFVYYHVFVVCVSYSWRSCPMRVLGLTMWLDWLIWPVGLTGWLNLSLSLPRPIGSLEPYVVVTSTHNDHIHGHIHQSQMCNLECNLWKFECPSHCKPETTIHKSQKVQFTFLCKSRNKVEICVDQLNAISILRLNWKVLETPLYWFQEFWCKCISAFIIHTMFTCTWDATSSCLRRDASPGTYTKTWWTFQ